MEHCYSLLLLIYLMFISTETTKLEDYCWRDYEGTIPLDALIGNEPGNIKPVYIGQVLYQEKIIPGKIYKNDKKIYFEYYDVEYSTEANAKILCTTKREKFQWIPVHNTDIRKLPGELLIKGGFEPKCQSYVGRVEIEGDFSPGKVICCEGVADCYGLYTTNNGTGSLHTSFQILRYNEKDPTDPEIDTRIGKCKNIVINVYN